MFASTVLRSFLVDDAGQGLVEYSLIIALVSLVAISGLTLFGKKTNNSLHAADLPLVD
ncbi:MAG: hypothetical protein NVS2B8_15740 [Vulcanimicrobiaceae bacterium]